MQDFIHAARRFFLIRILPALVLITLTACASQAAHTKVIPETAPQLSPRITVATVTAFPTPTLVPTLNADCVQGVWKVADFQNSIATSFDLSYSPLQIEKVEGETRYKFDSLGGLIITFDNLTTTMSGTIDGLDVAANTIMNGTATAQYALDLEMHQIVLSNFGGEGVDFALQMNGQTLAEGNYPAWEAFMSSLGGAEEAAVKSEALVRQSAVQARAWVMCQGNELILQALEPQRGPEILLEKVD